MKVSSPDVGSYNYTGDQGRGIMNNAQKTVIPYKICVVPMQPCNYDSVLCCRYTHSPVDEYLALSARRDQGSH